MVAKSSNSSPLDTSAMIESLRSNWTEEQRRRRRNEAIRRQRELLELLLSSGCAKSNR